MASIPASSSRPDWLPPRNPDHLLLRNPLNLDYIEDRADRDWFLRLAWEVEHNGEWKDRRQGRLVAKTYLFLRDFMPKGLTGRYGHISGKKLMRFLLCDQEHSKSRHRLWKSSDPALDKLQRWMRTGSSWEAALQNANNDAGGHEQARGHRLLVPEHLLALLVLDYPQMEVKQRVDRLGIQWMMGHRPDLDVTEGFWKGMNAVNVEQVFNRKLFTPKIEGKSAVDYDIMFGDNFRRCRLDMLKFLPPSFQHLRLGSEPDLSDVEEDGDVDFESNRETVEEKEREGDSNEDSAAKDFASLATPLSSVSGESRSLQDLRNTGPPGRQVDTPVPSPMTPDHTSSTNAAAGLSGRASQGPYDLAAVSHRPLGLFANRAKRQCSATQDAPNKAPRPVDLTREDLREELRAGWDSLQAGAQEELRASLKADREQLKAELMSEVQAIKGALHAILDKLEANVGEIKAMVQGVSDHAMTDASQLGADGYLDKHCPAPQGTDQQLYSLRLLRAGWSHLFQLGCLDDGAGADLDVQYHKQAADATMAKFSDVPGEYLETAVQHAYWQAYRRPYPYEPEPEWFEQWWNPGLDPSGPGTD